GAAAATLIDDRAVLTDQDRKYVYVLGTGNKAVRRDVTLGRNVEGLRVVESGLKPNEQVLVSGLQRVYFSGAPVAPKPVPMARAATVAAGPGVTPQATN